MRKYLYLSLALTGAMAIGVVSLAGADESVQVEKVSISPTKLDKKKYKPITFSNKITTAAMNPTGAITDQPPSATRTVLWLDKNIKLDTKSVKKCKVSSSGIEGSTPVAAIAACGKRSVVSVDKKMGTSAEVTVGTNGVAPQTIIPVFVTAFNGKEKNSLYLHSAPSGAFAGLPASILVGKLKNANKVKIAGGPSSTKPYKKALDVSIPPLGAGAISRFSVTIKAGKYIQARCKSKKFKVEATTEFSNAPTVSDQDVVKCKKKK